MGPDIVAALIAAAGACVLSPFVGWLARRERIVDAPGGRKQHREPTPLLGGLAVMGGVSVAFLATTGPSTALTRLGPALCVALVIGLLDDIRDLPAYVKLAGQALAAGLALLGVPALAPPLTGVPVLDSIVSVGLLIAVMNTVNFADTFDGLCALSVVGMLSVVGVLAAQPEARLLAAAGVGGCLGFLPWNVSRRAKLFLGDAGSLSLGLLVGSLALGTASDYAATAGPWMTVLLLCGVPLVDGATVTLERLRHRRALVVGARDHLSHRLVSLGVPVPAMVTVVAGATLGSALLAAAYVVVGAGPLRDALTAGSWVLAAGIVVGAGRVPIYEGRPPTG
jgi:UDP-GlcNAc:undecaprenyl-phosphate/decaprenyl-phosphate GlcNAc-1-phosphate transferase